MDGEVKRKKKLLWISSDPSARTGFSSVTKEILLYLTKYHGDEYEIFQLAQGTNHNPNIERFPWTIYPALTNAVDGQRFQNDPNFARAAAYGNIAILPLINELRPDIVAGVEDIWFMSDECYINSNWFKLLKDNILIWSTADSLPVLDQFKKYGEEKSGATLATWTSFAERALKEEDPERFKNVTTIHGCADTSVWKPLESAERLNLRRKWGIKDNEILGLKMGRNQLRKLYPHIIQEYGRYKKQNPGTLIRLVLHTSFSEGWNIPKLCKQHGVDREDYYVSYYCRNCSHYEVRHFDGENIECPACKAKDTFLTAGVQSTITNEQLAKIFSICDFSMSVATSGGFEMANCQSLLTELPLLCTEYSFGEDFIVCPSVTKLGGVYAYEHHTEFLKHVPSGPEIRNFLKKMENMTPEKRRELGKKGRPWAIERFDTKVIGEKIHNFFKDKRLIDWSQYHGEGARIEQYQPNAIIDPNLDGNELIKTLYKSILGMDLDHSDPGFQNWSNQLAQGAPKDQIVSYFRSVANQEIQKLSGLCSIEDLFDKFDKEQNLKRILLVCPESLGDTIILSSLFPSIRARYPRDKWKFYYATNPQYFEAVEGNPYIDKIIPYAQIMENLIYMEGSGEHKGFVDICYLPHLGSQRLLNYLHGGIDEIDLELK